MTRPNLLSLSKRVIVLGSRVQAQPSATVMWSSCPRAQGGKSRSPSSIEVTFIYYVSTFLGLFGPPTPLPKRHCKCCSPSFIYSWLLKLLFPLHSHSQSLSLFWTKKVWWFKAKIDIFLTFFYNQSTETRLIENMKKYIHLKVGSLACFF